MRLRLLPILFGLATPLVGQSKSIAPSPSRLFVLEASGTAVAPSDTLPKIGDHRVTGAVIGGVLGGALGYWAATGIGGRSCTTGVPEVCSDEVATLEMSLITIGAAAVGAGIGYLMGRSTPEAGPPSNVGEVAPIEDTGIQWWQGGLLGLGIGGITGAGIGKYYDTYHECGCEDPGMGVYVGAVVGGLIGILVGAGQAQDH